MKHLFTFILALCCVTFMQAQISSSSTFTKDLPNYLELPTVTGKTFEVLVNTNGIPANILSSTTLTFSWEIKNANASTWTTLSSSSLQTITTTAYGSTLTLEAGIPTSNAMKKLRCKIVAQVGTKTPTTSYSNTCTFVVTPTITTQPADVFYNSDDAYGDEERSFSVVMNDKGGTLSYQWYDASDNTVITGETDATYTFHVNDGIDSAYCKITSSLSSKVVTTAKAHKYFWYGLYVEDQMVTELNHMDILGDGTLYFDKDTLYLNNLNHTSDDANNFNFVVSLGALNIRCIGNNYLKTSTDGWAFAVEDASRLSITGDTLHLVNNESDAFTINTYSFDGTNVMEIKDMKNLIVETIGGADSFYGFPDTDGVFRTTLNIINSTVSGVSMYGFGEVNMDDDMAIFIPVNGKFATPAGKTYKALCNADGTAYRGTVTEHNGVQLFYIAPVVKYPIWIEGVQVTGINLEDVLGDGGSVSFDEWNNTLYLEDATLSSTSTHAAIQFEQNEGDDEFTVYCTGQTLISSDEPYVPCIGLLVGNTGFPTSLTVNFTGDTIIANATAVHTNALYAGIFDPSIQACDVKITDMKLMDMTGQLCGMMDASGTNAVNMDINDSKVRSNGIIGFASCNIHDLLVNDQPGAVYRIGNFFASASATDPIDGTITIRPAEKYFTVCGSDITEINYADVKGDGSLAYNPSTNTLILTNYVGTYPAGIQYTDYEGLTVECHGINKITSVLVAAVSASEAEDITFRGDKDASFEIVFNGHAANGPAILANKADFTVEGGMTFIATATDANSNNLLANVKSFTINNSNVTLDASANSEAVVLLRDVIRMNSHIVSGAYNQNKLVIAAGAAEGINDNEADVTTQKIIRGGQLIIIRDGKEYNALGVEIK